MPFWRLIRHRVWGLAVGSKWIIVFVQLEISWLIVGDRTAIILGHVVLTFFEERGWRTNEENFGKYKRRL